MPFTLNQLQSGRTSGAPLDPHAVQDVQFLVASSYQQDLLNLWWTLWKEQGFASLPPYGHLTKRHTGLKVGDVCLFNHDNKVCGTYRLCRVLSTTISTGGLARKVKVGYRERGAGEKYKPLIEVEIDVQRLVLLVPTPRWSCLGRLPLMMPLAKTYRGWPRRLAWGSLTRNKLPRRMALRLRRSWGKPPSRRMSPLTKPPDTT